LEQLHSIAGFPHQVGTDPFPMARQPPADLNDSFNPLPVKYPPLHDRSVAAFVDQPEFTYLRQV